MKILHVTASYKPAFVYGGPVMSVAKLCEEVSRGTGDRRPKMEDGSEETEDGGRKPDDRSPRTEDGKQKPEKRSQTIEVGSWETEVDITVYTTLANGAAELPYPNGAIKMVDGVKVHYFKRITKDHSHFSPALLWHLWRTVKQFDLVHIHAWWNLVTMPACLIAYLRGVKIVLSPRGTLSAYSFETDKSILKRLFHQLIGKRLLNSCFIHATSSKEFKDSLQLLSPKMVVNIPNFVAFPKVHQYQDMSSEYQDDKVLKMIFLSRIEQKKGLELFFESLRQVDFPWKLSIVGDGEKDYVERLKQKVSRPKTEVNGPRSEDQSLKPLCDQIKWLGPIYGEQKFEILSQHDLFVLPSFDENFANVVIESLYCGTPVCISKNVGLSDYVSKNQMGWVFERNAADLNRQLHLAYDGIKNGNFKPNLLNKKVMEDFKEQKITSQYLSFYQSVLKADHN